MIRATLAILGEINMKLREAFSETKKWVGWRQYQLGNLKLEKAAKLLQKHGLETRIQNGRVQVPYEDMKKAIDILPITRWG